MRILPAMVEQDIDLSARQPKTRIAATMPISGPAMTPMVSIPEPVSAPDSGLKWLIAPNDSGQFLSGYWERQPLTVKRGTPDYFGDLLSLDDIDRVLTANLLRVEDAQMTNAAREVKQSQYAYPTGVIDVAKLYQEFADGSTIILPQLHGRLPRLAACCRALEHEFSTRFQTNIYLTPGNAQGFKPHYDAHDVFILQISGTKRWRLYDTPVALPLRGQAFRPDEHTPGEITAEFTLGPGDTAYIPRGIMHDAESDGEMSLHITVGALVRTWHDLFVEALSGVSLNNAGMRDGLPVGFARPEFDRTNARAKFADLLRQMADQIDFDGALDRFADDIVATRNPLLWGQLEQIARLPDLSPENVITVRPDLILRMERSEEHIAIHCYGAIITLPSHAAEPAMAALSGTPSSIGDLPGDLDEAGKLVLVRRLVREGLVTVT